MGPWIRTSFVLAVTFTTQGLLHAQASFTPLADLPGGLFHSKALGVSPDGGTIVGESLTAYPGAPGSSAWEAFVWTPGSGMVGLGDLLGGADDSHAYGVSTGGAHWIGESDDASGERAVRDLVVLPVAPFSWARALSDSGGVVVGYTLGSPGGWYWGSGAISAVSLADLPGGSTYSSPRGVSGDGSFAVGSSESASGTEPCRWNLLTGGTVESLGLLAPFSFGEARDASSDGAVIVGVHTNFTVYKPWRWTAAGGLAYLLDGTTGTDAAGQAMACNADGTVIVGFRPGPAADTAWIWDQAHGTRDLHAWLASEHGLGAALTGWSLNEATGLSNDGRVIVGWGSNPAGDFEGWRVVLPGSPMISTCHPGESGISACPCANPPGASGRGCENSSFTGGGRLSAGGLASLAGDTLLFTADGLKPAATSVLIQGTGAGAVAGSLFGQGILCVGGSLKRLYAHAASAGTVALPGAGDSSVSARSAALGDTIAPGTSRRYAVYYRDPIVLGGCATAATFNVTQSGVVSWSP